MNRKLSILTVILLSLNVLLDPLVAVTKVYGQEESEAESSLIMETVPEEVVYEEEPVPVIEEAVDEGYESDLIEEPSVESEEVIEDVVEEVEETEESEESEESEETSEEEEKDPLTSINFNGGVTDSLYTGSEIDVPVLISNSEAELENAIVRYTISGDYIDPYNNLSAYFPYDNQAASEVYWNGSNLIVEYDLGTLSQEYSGGPSLSLKTIDNGTMRYGSQVSVVAEVIANGNVVAQTSYRNYNFVTRQPRFTTHVSTKESANSDDDEEGPSQQAEVSFAFDFDNNGVGNGSGQSEVTNITITTDVPGHFEFDHTLNFGWSFDENTRQATYSFTPDNSIYSEVYQVADNLILSVNDITEDLQTSIYSEALISFENGDSVTKTNQPEVMMMAAEVAPLAVIETNLVTGFRMTLYNNDNTSIIVNDGDVVDVDLDQINAVSLEYRLNKPNEPDFAAGDTYSMPLPSIFIGLTASNVPIYVDGDLIGTYEIVGDSVVITFTELVNNYDNVDMFVNVQGLFNVEVFETVEEVEVTYPYSDGTSYTATIRSEVQEIDGADWKQAGNPYILEGEGQKVSVDRNPTHIDWTVRVNDSMKDLGSAMIIDELGDGLAIVEGSFLVERIIRTRDGVDVGREAVTDFTTSITGSGFELNLGSIDDTYEITYSTTVTRPDGGGTHSFNNKARIILDGVETSVSDSFDGTWSGDLPIITKGGALNGIDKVNWTVEYNYGRENLGTVTLTDTLSHGEIDLATVVVNEVQTDIDGNASNPTPIAVTPTLDGEGNVQFPGLDAEGKAYLITFTSNVPVGLNGTVINTVTDDLPQPNSDDASVDVNTIPTGGESWGTRYRR